MDAWGVAVSGVQWAVLLASQVANQSAASGQPASIYSFCIICPICFRQAYFQVLWPDTFSIMTSVSDYFSFVGQSCRQDQGHKTVQIIFHTQALHALGAFLCPQLPTFCVALTIRHRTRSLFGFMHLFEVELAFGQSNDKHAATINIVARFLSIAPCLK